jgi:hypothetical protein
LVDDHQHAIHAFIAWIASIEADLVSAEELVVYRAVALRMIEDKTLLQILAIQFLTPAAIQLAIQAVKMERTDDETFLARLQEMQGKVDGLGA